VSFGGAEVGGSVTGAVTFTNDGGSPLSFDDVELPDAPFEVTGAPAEGSQLASDESTVVTLTFAPSELGDFNDELTVETSGGNKTIGLSGVAAPPGHLEIDPTALHFGAVPLGSELVRHFTLRNTGGLPVRITRSKRPGIPFYTGPELDEGTTIAAGDEEAFAVRFAPPSLGDFASRWQLNSDDGQGQRLVTFDGSGVPAPVEAPALPIPAPLAALTSRKASPPPRLALRLTRLRSRRVRIRVAGADTALVARAGVYVDGRRIGALRRPRLVRAVRLAGAGRHRVAVRVLLADGRTQWLRRTLRGL
jgi:iron transport multicopper oxidase